MEIKPDWSSEDRTICLTVDFLNFIEYCLKESEWQEFRTVVLLDPGFYPESFSQFAEWRVYLFQLRD